VLVIASDRVGANIVGLYLSDPTPIEAFVKIDPLEYATESHRTTGTGRRTMTPRRDIDDLLDNDEEDGNKEEKKEKKEDE